MYIWNKVLLGFICVASLVLFYVAARTLKTHQAWREPVPRLKKEIEKQEKDLEMVTNRVHKADGKDPGLREMRRELQRLLVDRGRMWEHCDPKLVKVEKETADAEISIALDPANPDGFNDKGKSIVYVFEEANLQNKGRYLGEFQLTPARDSDKQATLKPINKLTPREIDRLASAAKPWVMYEQMPHDTHAVFAHLSDEEMKALLPADVVSEYSKDGKPVPAEVAEEPADGGRPAVAEDAEYRIVNGKYNRWLRDYKTLFDADRANLLEMMDRFASTRFDKNLVDTALTTAKEQEEAGAKHVEAAQKRVAKYERERDIAKAYCDALKEKLATLTAEVAEAIETNKAMAGQLARLQWDAVHRIDQRVNAMVQADAEGK